LKNLRPAPQKFAKFIFDNFFCPCSDVRRLLYLLSFVFILAPSLAGAAQVSLAWAKSTGAAGYKMHYSNYSGNYQYTVNVGNSNSCTISGLTEGTTYYFAASAYDTQQNESDYSNEVCYTIYQNSNSNFADVCPGNWAEDYIHAIFNAEISLGCSQNPLRYCPGNAVTRDQMAAFLVRALEAEPAANYCATGSPFSDVSSSSGFCKYIRRLSELEITQGCGGGNYCPNDTVTRQQMAAFIVRAVEGEPAANYCAAGSPFSDVSSSSGFCKYIKRLSELEITQGCGGGNYCPNDTVTREVMAAFLARAFLGIK